jgi:hypothetical protein
VHEVPTTDAKARRTPALVVVAAVVAYLAVVAARAVLAA